MFGMPKFIFENCKQTAEKCKQIFENWKKNTASQTHFGFTNMGSEMNILRIIDNWISKFWFGSPCKWNGILYPALRNQCPDRSEFG